jgi:tetratricopeptide (TPR) repeat protein
MRALAAIAALLIGALAAAATGDVAERDLRQAMGYAQRGLSSLKKGNTARAREDFERAIAKIPDLPDAHTGFGHLAMRERRFDDALREYRLAESGAVNMASVLLEMESARFARSRDELERLRDMQRQLQQQAHRAEMRGAGTGTTSEIGGNPGQIQRQIAEVETRIRSYETMTPPTADVAPAAPAEILFFQGNALFDLKRTGEAIVVWEAAAKRLPQFGPLHNNLSVAYWMSGRLDDAWAALKRAETSGFKVNPNFRADLERAGVIAADRVSPATVGSP